MNRLVAIAAAVLWGLATLFAPDRAEAAAYSLWAKQMEKHLPNGTVVTMWGFADNAGQTEWAPGPTLTVLPGDNTLSIHLVNTLPVPVSIVIPGQTAAMAPVKVNGRVRSFTAEASENGGAMDYTFGPLTPGTYLYHSGTSPAVQVQMGLYGAMRKDAAAGEAYPGHDYENEVTLLYSEIDPVLHAAVAAGDYGPGEPVTSTMGYRPQYFLVNGEPFMPAQLPSPVGYAGERTLIRFLNAGLRTHVPVIQGAHLELVAEDGKVYPYPREQYSVELPALKTMDAVLTNPAAGIYPIYDRRLALANANGSTGGLLTRIEVMANPDAPIAVDDSATTLEDTPVSFDVTVNDGSVDASTVVITSGPSHGTAAVVGGVVTYSPDANYHGADSFTYTVESLAGVLSNEATATITIQPVNDAPAAAADEYHVLAGQTLVVPAPGVLANDIDVDGDALSAVVTVPPSSGLFLFQASGAFTYTPTAGGTFSFSYEVSDGQATSSATVTIIVESPPNMAPIANDDAATTVRNQSVVIPVLANDGDPDGSLVPGSVTIVAGPQRAGSTAVVNPNGTITYTPRTNWRGSDTFAYTVQDDDGAISNIATVRVNVVRP